MAPSNLLKSLQRFKLNSNKTLLVDMGGANFFIEYLIDEINKFEEFK